jgi:hypothetical protein
MTLGVAWRQADPFRSTAAFYEGRGAGLDLRDFAPGLYPDEMFADLFEAVGRRSAPQ